MNKKNTLKQKSKLLFIVQLPPPVHGVSMMNEFTVNSRLIRENFECETLALAFNESIKDVGQVSLNKLFKFILFYFKLLKVLVSFRPDIVYFTITPTGFSFYRDAFIVFLTKLTSAKVVLHLHGKGIKEETDSKGLKKQIYNLVFKNTYVIHLATSLKSDLQNLKQNYQSFVLPNGIKEASDVNASSSKQTHNQPIQILFLSNLAENKGVYTLLEAAKILRDKNLPFTLNYVGKETVAISVGNLLDRIKQFGLEQHVCYLGPKYGDEKNEVLYSSDILAFPTYNDCFPLVILEAMQTGIPVVSTFEGAIPEIITDGEDGYVIQYKEPALLAERLEELITNADRRKALGAKARLKFVQNYTLAQYEKNLYTILQQVDHRS